MFNPLPQELLPDDASECETVVPRSLRAIIEGCPALPSELIAAKFAHVEVRIMDEALLVQLSNLEPPESGTDNWPDRLRRPPAAGPTRCRQSVHL